MLPNWTVDFLMKHVASQFIKQLDGMAAKFVSDHLALPPPVVSFLAHLSLFLIALCWPRSVWRRFDPGQPLHYYRTAPEHIEVYNKLNRRLSAVASSPDVAAAVAAAKSELRPHEA